MPWGTVRGFGLCAKNWSSGARFGLDLVARAPVGTRYGMAKSHYSRQTCAYAPNPTNIGVSENPRVRIRSIVGSYRILARSTRGGGG